MLKKANQKRYLDDLVIQKGEFDWQSFFRTDEGGTNPSALQRALVEFEDFEDANAARIAAREEAVVEGEERDEFDEGNASTRGTPVGADSLGEQVCDEVAAGESAEELPELLFGGGFLEVELEARFLEGLDRVAQAGEVDVEGRGRRDGLNP